MHSPIVSTIIPCYNAEKYIAETIESVIKQTYQNWELIIIDDGSTDQSSAKIKPFLSNKKITYYHQKNAGVSAARNHGATLAEGKYLAFLDADDIWKNNFLSTLVGILDDNANVVLTNGNSEVIDEHGALVDMQYQGHGKNVVDDVVTFSQGYTTFPSNILCRKSAFEKTGGFNTALSNVADKMFFLDIQKYGLIKHVDTLLLQYREHPSSMHNNLNLMIRDYLKFYKIVKEKKLFASHRQQRICRSKIYRIIAGECYYQKQYIKMLPYTIKYIFTKFF